MAVSSMLKHTNQKIQIDYVVGLDMYFLDNIQPNSIYIDNLVC